MSDNSGTLERLILASSYRHGVLSSNIANADTPRYKAKDVDFESVLNDRTIAMKVTHPLHMKTDTGGLSEGIVTVSGEDWKDENNVELDQEVAKMTGNALLYQAGITMHSTKVRMFRNALRRA